MRTIIFTFLLAFSASASAQVYQCNDVHGNFIFSDQPCDTLGASGGPIQRGPSAEEIDKERQQAHEATERKYQRRAAEREQQAFDQQMEAAQQRQALGARAASLRHSDTPACKEAQKELEFVSSIRTISQDEKRMRTNAAIANVNAACGSDTPLLQEPPQVLEHPVSVPYTTPR